MSYQQQQPPPPQLQQQQQVLPFYDVFLDLPHPAASASCPPPLIIGGFAADDASIEREMTTNLSRIARFAFPEYDDQQLSQQQQAVPRDTALNRFSQYAMQPRTFQNYTFSMQLQSGVRLHGHVRRYLPVHPIAQHRYDVGRRGERALVIMTRFNGGDLVYASVLKTMDAITFESPALHPRMVPYQEHPKWFLHRLFEEHRKLCADFAALPPQQRQALLLTVENVEVGQPQLPLINQVDTCKYLIPTSMLASTTSAVEAVTTSPILPLLRVLGVSSTLRLLSALLSENRVLMISSSPTRLAQCARSALSILAQGLLNWQHLFIPVLPPHLFQYLGAPVPYLIGMLTSLVPRLEQAANEGLGEMVIINLDNQHMETRGIAPEDIPRKVPDLFQKVVSEQGMPTSTMSSSEMLAQDLADLLKVDKRVLYGESTLTNVSETAAKATKAVKSGISKLAKRGKTFFNNRMNSNLSDNAGSGTDEEAGSDAAGAEESAATPQNTLTPDFIYTQGSQNEPAEEEARIAFTSFFLSMFGNMRWYLSANPGQLPALDRNRFLQQKRSMGEGETTPIWPLLQNFVHTQMLEQFAKSRVEEVRLRLPVTADSPLFTQCSNYHRMHNIDFSDVNVRRVARQVAQSNPSRMILQTSARRTAMMLTSNRTFDGDYNKAVAQLVEECRECTSHLLDVMSVIWVRLRDSKGLHWKHGFQALQILRNLLYHGPIAAIAEATDGLDKIRAMKFYNDNMRSQICTQIRQAATQVYNLLVDRAKLFAIRRLCINKRRDLRKPDRPAFARDTRLKVTAHFSKIHPMLNPRSHARVAPSGNVSSAVGFAGSPAAQFSGDQDLLGLAAPAPIVPANVFADPPQLDVQNSPQDIVGLFQNASISSNLATPVLPAPSAAAPGVSVTSFDPFGSASPAQPPPATQPPASYGYSSTAQQPAQTPFGSTPAQAQQQYFQQAQQQQAQQQHAPTHPFHPHQASQQQPVGHHTSAAAPPPPHVQHQAYYHHQHVQQGHPQQQQPQHPPAGYPPQQYQHPQQQQYHYAQQTAPGAASVAGVAQPQPPDKPNVSQFDPFK